MRSWFKRGGDKPVADPFARAVETAAAGLPGGEGLARDVAQFVTTGEPVQVLAAQKQAGSFGYAPIPPPPLQDLYAELCQADPDAWVRWARVLEASYGTSQWSTPLANAGAVPAWLERLLINLADAYGPRHQVNRRQAPEPVPVSFQDLAAVVVAGGVDVAQLLDAVFTASSDMQYSSSFAGRRVLAGTTGFADAVTSRLDRLGGRLTAGSVEQRLLFCELVSGFDDDHLARLAPGLAAAATATSAQVRDVARPLLLRVPQAALPALREVAVDGKPDARAAALELLWQHGEEADRDFALESARADRTPRIRTLVEDWTAAPAVADAMPSELQVPEPGPVDWRVELTPALRGAVEQVVRRHHEEVARHNREQERARAAYRAAHNGAEASWIHTIPEDPTLAQRVLDQLASDGPPVRADRVAGGHLVSTMVTELAAHPEATPVVVVKALASLGLLGVYGQLGSETVNAIETCHARGAGPDLLTLQKLLDETGLSGRQLVWAAITSSWQALGRGWPAEDVWPFLAHNIDFVVDHATSAEGVYTTDESAFYRLIGTLPAQPPALVQHLYALALGPSKAHRAAAQHALRDHPDRSRRVLAALTDGKSEVRTVAAAWAAAIGDPAAVPALEAAVAKEKHDVAKGALLDALEALGRPVEAYLDRDRLAVDAEKAVAKGLPAALAWLSWERLPTMHWADSGEQVPTAVAQHLVAQAVRAKNPEPNAVLRKYAGMVAVPDRERFAHVLLESWLAADVAPISAEEAQQRAHQEASSMHHWMQRNPAAFQGDPLLGLSIEELTAHYLPGVARTPAGSEAASKGVLAVVAAMGGREVVPPTERYLKEWYGQRAAQGKALIAMLAWVQHPAAVQLLLSIGSRFRTKGFQVEATRQVEALAEREGWTVAELADRTISTAGFDADGRMELSYGPRGFVVRLLPDLGLEIRDDDDRVVKALPTPRQSDDAELAKAARATFAGAKKELKSLVPLLRERLYDALCTERTWPATDWQRFLAGHPVMRLLCQRLVWVAQHADGSRLVFRLLDDGTLSDVDDEEVTLREDDVVRLAHDTLLTTDEVASWLTHLEDYEVQPLFAQLGKEIYDLPEDLRHRSSLDDVRGHTLEAFALRSRATKLGWTRGPAEDAGWFHSYRKRFPSLGLVAQLAFTGNGLPEENRLVALLDLSFHQEGPDGDRATRTVRLGDVPVVLLSETWHDVRVIAAEGGGHDPDWERKTQL